MAVSTLSWKSRVRGVGGGRGGRIGGLAEVMEWARARASFIMACTRGELSWSGGLVGRNGRVVREGEMGVLETTLQVEEVVEEEVVEGLDAMMTGVEGWFWSLVEGLHSVQVGEEQGEKRSGSMGEVSVVSGAVG